MGNGVNSPSSRRVPGETEFWVLIMGEMAIFALFFASFMIGRNADPAVYQDSQAMLNQAYGLINTLLLITSSWLVFRGVHGMNTGSPSAAKVGFYGAFLCGIGFCVSKALEYSEKIDAGITPYSNSFFTYYYMFTGIHLVHVIVGMGVLLLMISSVRADDAGADRRGFIECGATYWHMVDLIWIVLFTMIYVLRQNRMKKSPPNSKKAIRSGIAETFVWGVLLAATLLVWYIGVESNVGPISTSIVVAVAFLKLHLVGNYFMEVRNAPLYLRTVFEVYSVVVCFSIWFVYCFT